MFPPATPVAKIPCQRCGTPTRVDRLWAGAYGVDCAEQLGLKTARTRLRIVDQVGPDLFAAVDEDDHCDGWDR
jgi:hypothetical protein